MSSFAERLARQGQPERYTARTSQRAALHNLLRGGLAEIPGLFTFLNSALPRMHGREHPAAVAHQNVQAGTHEAFPDLVGAVGGLSTGAHPPGYERLLKLLEHYHDLRGRPADDARLQAFLTVPGFTRQADLHARRKLVETGAAYGREHPVVRLLNLLRMSTAHPAVVAAAGRSAPGATRGHLEPLLHLLHIAGSLGGVGADPLIPAVRENVRSRTGLGELLHHVQHTAGRSPEEEGYAFDAPENFHTLRRSGPLVRLSMSPTQAGALRRYLMLNQRVGGLGGGTPDLQSLLATMTPQEQSLLLELFSSGVFG